MAFPASAQQSAPPGYGFVKEFIRGLGSVERLRTQGEADAKKPGANALAVDVRTNTQIVAELKSEIAAFNAMKLPPPNANVPGQFAQLYQLKVGVYEQLLKLGDLKLNGAKPGVDYSSGEISIPKLRSNIDELDGALYEVTTLVFTALIGDQDAGAAKRLVITKAQKAALIADLEKAFGPKLKQKSEGLVGSAGTLLTYLRDSSYKCKDE